MRRGERRREHELVDRGLVGPGLPWRQLDVVGETGSTNADLITRAEGGADIDGSVLLAEYQNAGRGRQGRQWSAPPRAQIALSVGVGGNSVPRSGWGWLPLAAGVAVADALTALGGSFDVGLKWPNDLLIDRNKFAGILVEGEGAAVVICSRNDEELAATAAELAKGADADWRAVVLTAGGAVLVWRTRLNPLWALGAAAGLALIGVV